MMNTDKKYQYLKRLMKPYKKKNQQKFFITQYLEADGHELEKKFWSDISSSRLAFELYSWLANEDCIIDFEFEHKLTGLRGSKKQPNMDVFIETKDSYIFIESKYTETSSPNIDGLSQSYYEYEGVNTKGEKIRSTLSERYYGLEDIAERIRSFVIDIKNRLDGSKNKSACWMDYKQEITHLVGIILSLKKDHKYNRKDIKFYNIYYKQDVETNDDIEYFFDKARNLLADVIGEEHNFVYEHKTVQEIMNVIKEKDPIAFGTTDRKVCDILKEEFKL